MTEREAATARLAAALQRAMDSWPYRNPDRGHAQLLARIAIERAVVPMAKALGPLSMLERDIPWSAVCAEETQK